MVSAHTIKAVNPAGVVDFPFRILGRGWLGLVEFFVGHRSQAINKEAVLIVAMQILDDCTRPWDMAR